MSRTRLGPGAVGGPRRHAGRRRFAAPVLALIFALSAASGCGPSSPVPESDASPNPSPTDEPEIWSTASSIEMTEDPVGDSLPETSPFMDTVGYGVDRARTDDGASFLFAFETADSIPGSFEVPLDHDAAQYSFCLDTDDSSSPGGYPFATGEPVPCDFILTAVSEGGPWTGTLIDRRPLLEGDDADTRDIDFLIRDADGLFVVGAQLLDDPRAFGWSMTASLLMLPLPSDDFIDLDANYEAMLAFEA